jgi:hypothetical protein
MHAIGNDENIFYFSNVLFSAFGYTPKIYSHTHQPSEENE